MAQKPDGRPARTERVAFTRPAADRIAKVVRTVEAGNRDGAPLTFGSAPGVASKTFRMATFSGAWAINSAKTVTYRGITSTPNTVSAQNILLDIPNAGTAATRNCAIAKDGTAWYLVFPQVRTRDVTLASGTQSQSVVSGISLSGSLNTSNCSITIGSTLTTASITVQTGTYTATIITLESL